MNKNKLAQDYAAKCVNLVETSNQTFHPSWSKTKTKWFWQSKFMQLLLVTDIDKGIDLGNELLSELDPKMEISDLSELKWLLGTSYIAR
jgi:hypothetical protein